MKNRKRIHRWILAAAVAGFLASVTSAAPQKKDDAEVSLQAAIQKETVDGDLRGAIERYKKLAQTGNRSVAAQALIHMAECYRKLGDDDSRKTFERVVRDYADQTEAVKVARTRLETSGSGKSMTTRKVWSPPDPSLDWSFSTGATVSADGRFMTYTDWDTGHLGLHELATGRDRRLTKSGLPNWAEESAISRDSRQVAYSWFKPESGRYDLRIVPLETAGVADPRVVFDSEDVSFVMPNDWSPDGNWIAVQFWRTKNAKPPAQDNSMAMGLISVHDGSLRQLSSDWWGASKLFFSPDGKYLGFDLPVGESKDQRDVFIQDINGTRQIPVAVGPSNDTMMGWSPDGKFLLFASDRGGSMGLWAVPIANGTPQGVPELLTSGISPFSLGVTTAGSLYWAGGTSDSDIRIASVDFETGQLLSGPIRPIQTFVGTNGQPAWSADGKYLAYKSWRSGLGSAYFNNDVLGILSVETGQVRELRPKIAYFQAPRWTRDGQSVTVYGKDPVNKRQGPFQIDLQTAQVKFIDGTGNGPTSPDGKLRYSRKDLGAEGFSFVEENVASGKVSEIFREKGLGRMSLSPDGRFIATFRNAESNNPSLLLVPVGGGDARELFRLSQRNPPAPNWMPNSRAFLITNETADRTELLLVPVAGGQPRKIDVGASHFQNIQVNPDGRQIAYVSGEAKEELWVLENFLPATKNRK
jgi:Tol biopolymer transport system component